MRDAYTRLLQALTAQGQGRYTCRFESGDHLVDGQIAILQWNGEDSGMAVQLGDGFGIVAMCGYDDPDDPDTIWVRHDDGHCFDLTADLAPLVKRVEVLIAEWRVVALARPTMPDFNQPYCFIIPASQDDTEDGYIPSIVFVGESGHFPMAGGEDQAPWRWGDYEQAWRIADEENKRLGISRDTAIKMMCQSMRR